MELSIAAPLPQGSYRGAKMETPARAALYRTTDPLENFLLRFAPGVSAPYGNEWAKASPCVTLSLCPRHRVRLKRVSGREQQAEQVEGEEGARVERLYDLGRAVGYMEGRTCAPCKEWNS